MSTYPTKHNTTVKFLLAAGLTISSISASSVFAQRPTSGTAFPGPAARENNRSMDDYDREINRMKNDAKAKREKRLNLFPQINEDFQKIQSLHNEIVRIVQSEKSPDYARLINVTIEMRKRGIRLKTNLALPEPDPSEPKTDEPTKYDETSVKHSVRTLHDLIVSFVGNPIFKNLGVFDTNEVNKASNDLRDIIQVSDEIKRSAETLTKTANTK